VDPAQTGLTAVNITAMTVYGHGPSSLLAGTNKGTAAQAADRGDARNAPSAIVEIQNIFSGQCHTPAHGSLLGM
jgi:hypothetical protein